MLITNGKPDTRRRVSPVWREGVGNLPQMLWQGAFSLVLWLQNRRAMAVCYLFSMVFVDIWMTCFCIEYVTTFLVLNGVMLVLLRKLSKGKEITEKSFFPLFAISGVVTAFVDFLTTETITFSILKCICMLHK